MKIRKIYILILILIIEIAIIVSGSLVLKSEETPEHSSVLLIDIQGEIITKTYPGLYGGAKSIHTSSTDIVKILQHYEKSNNIKAFILEIDSNGGEDIADSEIVMQIHRMKKPVVAVVRDSALSSGYYVAAGTKRIFVSETSSLADIGIVYRWPYIDSKGNEQTCSIPSTPYKNMYLSDCKDLKDEEYELVRNHLHIEHGRLMVHLSYFRNLPFEKVIKLSDGTIFKGAEAVENGLADQVGDAIDAKEWLEKELGTKLDIVYYRELAKNPEVAAIFN